jgi:hypothetical protein
VQSNATNNFAKPVVKATPVATGPKTGSSEFYRGYTDAYEGRPATGTTSNYGEGWVKGYTESKQGANPRYQYVSTPSKPVNGVWPFPTKG